MSIFKLRPLAFGCFASLIVLYLSYFLGNIFRIALMLISAIALMLLIILTAVTKNGRIEKWLIKLLPMCLCIIICLTSALFTFARAESIKDEYCNTEKEITLIVKEIRFSRGYETLVIAKTNSESRNFEMLLSLPDDKISIGDEIKASVAFRALIGDTLGYNEEEYYLDKGIYLYGEAGEYETISRNNFIMSSAFKKINLFLNSIVEKSLNSDTASLVSAMLLGNKDALGDDVKRDFSRLGISHILALSGIHISLITSMANAFFGIVKLRKRPRYLALVGMIVFFICITGFSESAIRAGIMLIIFYTMSMLGLKSDGITSLFLSAFLICAIDPYAIFSTSLLLSFCAMLACICTSYFTRRARHLRKIKPKPLRNAAYTLITSTAVVIFTLPIMAIKFDHVSVFAPIFNIFFVPLLTLLLYLSPFILIFGTIPYIGIVFTYPAELITRLALFLTSNISKADFLTISLTNVLHTIGVVIVVLAIALGISLNKKKVKICVCILIFGALMLTSASAISAISRDNTVTISSYDYRASDVIAIESENEVMIIEVSSPSASTMSMSSYYASDIGYSDIQLYIIADYSYRIAEAFDSVTDKSLIRSAMLPYPETELEVEQYKAVKEIADKKGIYLSEIEESVKFGDTCVDFMDYEILGRSTKRCVAFSVTAKNSRFTYIGSSAYECINYFPGNYAPVSDVVLFGSYGPVYKLDYTYDLTNVDYLVFHGDSQAFCADSISDERIKQSGHKFILK